MENCEEYFVKNEIEKFKTQKQKNCQNQLYKCKNIYTAPEIFCTVLKKLKKKSQAGKIITKHRVNGIIHV